MVRAIFWTMFWLLTGSLSVVGAVTTFLVVSIATGYVPIEEGIGYFAEAVAYAQLVGAWAGGTTVAACIGRAAPFVLSAIRGWFGQFVQNQIAEYQRAQTS